MLDKSIEKLAKHTKKLLESVEIKYEGPRTEGQECEGIEVVLEHSGYAVDFLEVGSDKVARVALWIALEIIRDRAWRVVRDENEDKEMKWTSLLLRTIFDDKTKNYIECF